MFEKLGAMMSLLGNRGKIQEEIQKFQAQIGTLSAEATAGAGYVTVKVNGRMEIQTVRISEEAMALNDREMLEDLVAAATNQALQKVRELLAAESAKMAQNIGLPPGMLGGAGGIPGLG
ncbi:MAG: YbaB/EbfC family nucleoid-associated protein [Gemmataceae bacterium]